MWKLTTWGSQENGGSQAAGAGGTLLLTLFAAALPSKHKQRPVTVPSSNGGDFATNQVSSRERGKP